MEDKRLARPRVPGGSRSNAGVDGRQSSIGAWGAKNLQVGSSRQTTQANVKTDNRRRRLRDPNGVVGSVPASCARGFDPHYWKNIV
ncbi:unnamed protein product, partial [Iphiclides podalirius]